MKFSLSWLKLHLNTEASLDEITERLTMLGLEVDSATDQFFINTVDNDFLNNGARDFGYAVFGRVIEGTEVVDSIAAAPVTNSLPNETVLIRAIRRQ